MTARARVFKPQHPSHAPAGAAAHAVGTTVFRRLGLSNDRAQLVKQIHRGFGVVVVEKLADELRVSQQTVLKVTKIAPSNTSIRKPVPPRCMISLVGWSTAFTADAGLSPGEGPVC